MCYLCEQSEDGVVSCQDCGRLICFDTEGIDDVCAPAYVTESGDLYCRPCGARIDEECRLYDEVEFGCMWESYPGELLTDNEEVGRPSRWERIRHRLWWWRTSLEIWWREVRVPAYYKTVHAQIEEACMRHISAAEHMPVGHMVWLLKNKCYRLNNALIWAAQLMAEDMEQPEEWLAVYDMLTRTLTPTSSDLEFYGDVDALEGLLQGSWWWTENRPVSAEAQGDEDA